MTVFQKLTLSWIAIIGFIAVFPLFSFTVSTIVFILSFVFPDAHKRITITYNKQPLLKETK